MNKTNFFTPLWKGLVIGGTMLVPGVSGGSMAMILGIYNQLISAVSSLFSNLRKNLLFLIQFVAGAGIGILLFAKPLLTLIELYPKPMLYFFLGAVAGGVPLIYKQAKVKHFSFFYLFYILIGILLVSMFALFPTDVFSANNYHATSQMLFLFIAGLIAAIALVLPGISVSYLLLVLGLYDKTMQAISAFDMGFLVPLGFGVLAGILLVTKTLEFAMDNYPKITYFIILGFVLGSLYETFPGLPVGLEWIICSLMVATGFLVILILSEYEEKL
ncbi:MAG: DUF368 domain-containing protein [Lachnospiraceae bacterium]|nr:DUF368 domain-containing protein [Lachnospiraceae bacterium]